MACPTAASSRPIVIVESMMDPPATTLPPFAVTTGVGSSRPNMRGRFMVGPPLTFGPSRVDLAVADIPPGSNTAVRCRYSGRRGAPIALLHKERDHRPNSPCSNDDTAAD